MKNIRFIIPEILFFSLMLLIFSGCHDIKIGYLETENAIYVPDSMVIKSVLDEKTDAQRIKFGIPWQSTSIEGIKGTTPIRYSIAHIKADNGYQESMSQIQVVRDGVFEVPYNHTLPVGRYVICLRIYNEGYTNELDSIYTVIVE